MRVFLCLFLLGCGHHFDVETPETFVELDEDTPYSYRATSAKGVVIAIREIPNEPRGDLSFWAEAIRDKIRINGGYALLEERSIELSTTDGLQLRFGRDVNGQSYRYWLTLFVDDDYLHIVEAGGIEPEFVSAQRQIEAAVSSLRL